MDKGKLYLIPSLVGNTSFDRCIPAYNKDVVNNISVFIVEEIKTAYRTLRSIGYEKSFEGVTFFQLNEHTRKNEISNYLDAADNGFDIGLLSEAGLPCIADPGAIIVNAAHSKGIRIIPLIGPSSILSALISSGMCGQSFAFNGYLPIKSPAKENKIKQLEKISLDSGQTQIFIEAPYRNIQLLKTLISTCKPDTLISIACNLHCDDELIISKEVYLWSMAPLPDINKKPAVFCINGKNMYI